MDTEHPPNCECEMCTIDYDGYVFTKEGLPAQRCKECGVRAREKGQEFCEECLINREDQSQD